MSNFGDIVCWGCVMLEMWDVWDVGCGMFPGMWDVDLQNAGRMRVSKLWKLVEEARRSNEKQIPIGLDNIRAYIEKAVLLLGWTSDYNKYFRRYNILAAFPCPAQQSKEMLK